MENFETKYEQLKNEIIDFIHNKLKINSNKIELITKEEIEVENLWEYPQIMVEGRHGDVCYYHVINITLERENMWFNSINIEDDDNEYVFSINEINLEALVQCANLIQ